MDVPASVYAKPTTLRAVRAAGILLSEEPNAHATLRVVCVCILVPHPVEGVVHFGYAVQRQRANKTWVDIMADLPAGEADDANVERAEALFGATPEERLDMLQLARQTAVAVRQARSRPHRPPFDS